MGIAARQAVEHCGQNPAEVHRTILEQHERIRTLLGRLERRAMRLLARPVPRASDCDITRRSALTLCAVMARHIEEENRLLLPVLEQARSWGATRAARLRAEHEEQLLLLRAYAATLEHPGGSSATLALIAWQLAEAISDDMEQEEACVLSSRALTDAACFSG